jgi:hypothetical protein
MKGTGIALPDKGNDYACNPAHAYPGGALCISIGGSLTLVTLTQLQDLDHHQQEPRSTARSTRLPPAARLGLGLSPRL